MVVKNFNEAVTIVSMIIADMIKHDRQLRTDFIDFGVMGLKDNRTVRNEIKSLWKEFETDLKEKGQKLSNDVLLERVLGRLSATLDITGLTLDGTIV